MTMFCPAEPTWLEAASFAVFYAVVCLQTLLQIAHVSVKSKVFISVALTLTLLREHFPNQRVFLICPTSFSSLASRLSLTPTTFLGTR